MRFVNPGGCIVKALKNPGTFTVSIRSTWNVFDRLLSSVSGLRLRLSEGFDKRRQGRQTPRMEPTSQPGWVAVLDGEPFDLTYWERALQPPFDPHFHQIQNGSGSVWGLHSSSFDGLQ